MNNLLAVPRATEDAVEHADWLELRALEADDRSASFQDLVREIRRSGTTDAIGDSDAQDYRNDPGEEQSQEVAENALAEIQDRIDSSGGNKNLYPFEFDSCGQLLKVCNVGIENTLYLFLLLLSRIDVSIDKKQAKVDATQVFEEICGEAVRAYLGGDHPHVGIRLFGFPRRQNAKGFAKALDELCGAMGEGVRHRDRPTLTGQKDAKLDLVGWRGFGDKRKGKLIAFAQCKTGRNWERYLRDLIPLDFCQTWLQENPPHLPIRLFFVPCRISGSRWYDTCSAGGILFERSRIAEYASNLDPKLSSSCHEWVRAIISKKIHAKGR